MKQILFSFFLICCMAIGDFKANAQEVFAPIGAEWHYYGEYYSRQGNGQYWATLYHNVVTGDTLIFSIPARKITQTAVAKTIYNAYQTSSTTVIQDTQKLRTLYVYDNTDTVFIFNENFQRFTPLYVFNVQEGDTICLPVISSVHNVSNLLYHPVSKDTSFCFQIDSIRIVNYNNLSLKVYYNHPVTDDGYEYSDNVPMYNWSYYNFPNALTGAYAQQLGGLKGGLLPTRLGDWEEKAIVQNLEIDLRCYSDSMFNVKLTDDGCKDLIPDLVSILGISTNDFSLSIYPNPGKEKITIESDQIFPANTVVLVTDLAGKIVRSHQTGIGKISITIELDNVHAGIYLLRIDAGKYSVNHKLVICR